MRKSILSSLLLILSLALPAGAQKNFGNIGPVRLPGMAGAASSVNAFSAQNLDAFFDQGTPLPGQSLGDSFSAQNLNPGGGSGGVNPPSQGNDSPEEEPRYWVELEMGRPIDKAMRQQFADLGFDIVREVNGTKIEGIATRGIIKKLVKAGIKVPSDKVTLVEDYVEQNREIGLLEFPPQDAPFHDYAETEAEMRKLAKENPELISMFSIGQSQGDSTQGIAPMQLWCLRFNTDVKGKEAPSERPGVLFTGAHHAREHLSTEIPLMLAQYLAKHKEDPRIKNYLAGRDIYIVPIVNPDGKEYDIKGGNYKLWRKNRRKNNARSFGVDLNRNYGGPGYGGEGSSGNPTSDIYHGPEAFSESETRAIRDLVLSKTNISVLLTVHTYSQLILYPNGHTTEPISRTNPQWKIDEDVYGVMAKTMAKHNGYTPQQSSDLYVASGDTTDWSYHTTRKAMDDGKRKFPVFSFTFELDPAGGWGGGGFYPGAGVIDSVFKKNLEPMLYLIEKSADPYGVLLESDRSM